MEFVLKAPLLPVDCWSFLRVQVSKDFWPEGRGVDRESSERLMKQWNRFLTLLKVNFGFGLIQRSFWDDFFFQIFLFLKQLLGFTRCFDDAKSLVADENHVSYKYSPKRRPWEAWELQIHKGYMRSMKSGKWIPRKVLVISPKWDIPDAHFQSIGHGSAQKVHPQDSFVMLIGSKV